MLDIWSFWDKRISRKFLFSSGENAHIISHLQSLLFDTSFNLFIISFSFTSNSSYISENLALKSEFTNSNDIFSDEKFQS